jgi:iron complex outermembrane receptor protein
MGKGLSRPAAGILAALVVAVPPAAFAAGIEEIVVTAQKREQSLTDVGIAITAFQGDRLTEMGMYSTEDLTAQTPGLMVSEFAGVPSVTVFSIRGVSQNDFADHHEGPNAVYTDGAYTSFLGGIGSVLYDVDRVEVLRGPQGTLFGRNATGGLLHVISKRPTEEFEAYADVTVGEYDLVRTEGAISGKITDRVLGRLSFATNYHDALVDNRIGPDVWEAEEYNGRGQLLLKLSDNAEFLINMRASVIDDIKPSGHYNEPAFFDPTNDFLTSYANPAQHQAFCQGLIGIAPPPESTDCFGFVEPDNDPFTGSYDDKGVFSREFYGATGTLEWDLGSVQLTSITDFQTINKEYSADTDGSPIESGSLANQQDSSQFSQEIRLSGEMERLRWVAGLYYLNIDGDFVSEARGRSTLLMRTVNHYHTDVESFAVFGQVEYDIHPDWTVIAGLRWTEDESSLDFDPSCEGIGCPFFVGPLVGTVQQDGFKGSQDKGDYSAKIQLNWHPTDELLLYAGVTRGTKAGGFTASSFASQTSDQIPFDQEVLTAYEGGFKATLFNSTTQLNGSVFYYDYSDYQAFSFLNLSPVVFNRDATVTGGEIELYTRPWDGWEFSFGISLLDGEVEDIILPSGRVADQDMPLAPDVSFNGMARYEWPAFNGVMAIQADMNYVGERVFDTVNHPVLYDGDYIIGNARLSYATNDGRWTLALFVRNIGDEQYVVRAFDIAGLNGTVSKAVNAPRWFGGQIRYQWQ